MTQIKTGTKVALNGERGTITEVMTGLDGNTYARVHFDGAVSNYSQYQDRFYKDTDFKVI